PPSDPDPEAKDTRGLRRRARTNERRPFSMLLTVSDGTPVQHRRDADQPEQPRDRTGNHRDPLSGRHGVSDWLAVWVSGPGARFATRTIISAWLEASRWRRALGSSSEKIGAQL